jgi:formylglycine-generating enzyme required for sulfatase activity
MPVERTVDLGDGAKLELVLIPAGLFDMGSADAGPGDEEGPLHRVRLSRPFYMGKYEVTQDVWQKVMGGNPSVFKGDRNPVDSVSWDECQDFLKKLNALGKDPGQFRLPTEAEWEWACRAGTSTQFSFGDADVGMFAHAWHWGNSGEFSHPVGTRKPNAWGLFDMHGNAWEWCSDWFDRDYYAKSPKKDPTGPGAGSDRVLRGGSWGGTARDCRSAHRCGLDPAGHSSLFGFRVVLAPLGR